MTKQDIRRVERAAVKAARSRADLHEAIRLAVAAGGSTRAVGAAAGLSHTEVRRIVSAQ